jgi:hypothetical protein
VKAELPTAFTVLMPKLPRPFAVTVRVRSGAGPAHAAPAAAQLHAMHTTVRGAREACAGLEREHAADLLASRKRLAASGNGGENGGETTTTSGKGSGNGDGGGGMGGQGDFGGFKESPTAALLAVEARAAVFLPPRQDCLLPPPPGLPRRCVPVRRRRGARAAAPS